MGRRYQDGVEVGLSPEDAMRALCDSVTRLAAANSVRVDGWTVSATVRVSIWSWGERVEGWVQTAGQGARVEASSTCRAQLFDWGKNRRNVEQILRPFYHQASSPTDRS